nr:hypothetical protein [Tanacetum cinerariifolium]
MSRDVLTVSSTMRIPLLYRGEYSQWVERFMNYLEEQTGGEAMINSIKNGDQPLPRVTQVSIIGTSSTEQPPLKDKSIWSDQEKKIQKVDYLWDALARHMLGFEYGEHDMKATVLYEYETFKATEGELFLDTYIRYLQNKNLMDINIDALYNILKRNQGDVNNFMRLKNKTVVVTSDPLALIAEKTKVSKTKEKVVVSSYSKGNDAEDFSELKKITALLGKAFNGRNDSNQEINANMVFMVQIEKVLSDSEASSSSVDDNIFEVSYYLSEIEYEYETSEYYDNTTTYGLFVNDNDNQEFFHDCKNFPKNLIESQIDHNESAIDHNDSEGIDKLIRKFNKKIVKCLKRIEKAN